jgi:hypothetical protein
LQVDVLNVDGSRLKYHLELHMLVEAIRILAITTVCGAAARLNVGDSIRCGAEYAEECFGVHCAGADFDIVRLLKDAALLHPEMREFEDQVLEIEAKRLGF